MPEQSLQNRRTARFRNQPHCQLQRRAIKMHGSRAKCKGVQTLTGINTALAPEISAHPGLEIASGISNSLPSFSAQDTAPGNKRKTIRVTPLGEFPIVIGGRRYIQVVDEQAVNMMVDHFHLPIERLRQVFNNLRESWHPATGVSIYEGHIDDPEYLRAYKVSNTDNRALARIKTLHIDPDTGELMADIAVNDFGLALMGGEAPAYGYHSPHWRLIPAPDRGPNHVRPALLLSSALTNTPNIPDNHIAFNAKPTDSSLIIPKSSLDEHPMNPDLLKKLNLPADATPDQIDGAVNTLLGKVDILDTAASEATNTITGLNTQLTESQAAANTARKALIDHHLDEAIKAGRITAAQRPEWQGKADAAADLPAVCNTLADLSKLQPALTTAANSLTGALSKDTTIVNSSGRIEDQINAAANTIMAEQHVDRKTAFNLIEKDHRFNHLLPQSSS